MSEASGFRTQGGFTFTGEGGLAFRSREGLPAGTRSVDGDDPFVAACAAVSALTTETTGPVGIEVAATVTIEDLQVPSDRSRGADGTPPALRIEAPPGVPPGERRYLALVEEGDTAHWVVDDGGVLTIPAAPPDDGTERNAVTSIVRRVVRVLAVKATDFVMDAVGASLVDAWDRRRIPESPDGTRTGFLRSWTTADHRSSTPTAMAASGEGPHATPAPALLVIHGFTGSTHGSFRFEDRVVTGLTRSYGALTMAYDHPTVVPTPRANAEDLLRRLHAQVPRPLTIDVLAHSRGGLVARELAVLAATDDLVSVRSITFVATPNAGTPLADPDRPEGLLDAVTTVVGHLGGDAVELAVALAQDVLLRGVAPHLTGWMAMGPEDDRLGELNAAGPPPGVTLRAIAADYEPRTDTGLVRKARDLAIDLYFGSVRNDLIVPTRSTIETDQAFHVDVTRRLVLDSSWSVDHSTFWTNTRVTEQLLRWFSPDLDERDIAVPFDEADPLAAIAEMPPSLGTQAVEVIKRLPAKVRAGISSVLAGPIGDETRPPKGDRTPVVVLPGIMGTHLAEGSPDGRRIWIDGFRLGAGAFRDLVLPAPGEPQTGPTIHPAGLDLVYLPLITHLSATYDVYPFGFDWRKSIADSSAELATFIRGLLHDRPADTPVHIVAHSMGGLVARGVGMTGVDPTLWRTLGKRHGKVVMLGTPNRGSYAMPLVLVAEEMLVKAVALIDRTADKEALAETISTFPGVYEMLPFHGNDIPGDRSRELYRAEAWGRRHNGDLRVRQDLLDAAIDVQERLGKVKDGHDRLRYIAGSRKMTPFRLATAHEGRFGIGQNLYGDGRVAHVLGELDDTPMPTWFVEAGHGELPSQPEVIAAVDALLADTEPDLPTAMAPLRSADGEPSREEIVDLASVDPEPGLGRDAPRGRTRAHDAAILAEGRRLVLGGTGTGAIARRTVLRVSVVNGSLEMARYPVAVGHYSGLLMGGAEAFLDRALGQLLTSQQGLGGYPEAAGSGRHYPAGHRARPPGALVLGLGDYAGLSAGVLAESMATAVADLLAATCPRGETTPSVGISTVLVGAPGRRGLGIDDAVTALAEGTILGLERFRRSAEGTSVREAHLEVIERYAQAADTAARAVADLGTNLPRSVRDAVDLRTAELVAERAGRLPGAPDQRASGRPWVKVVARLDPAEQGAAIRSIQFSLPSHRAQSRFVAHPIEHDLTTAMIANATRGATPADMSAALFALLLPFDLKLDLDQRESLHLVLDRELAKVPWELLGGTPGNPQDSFALRAGFLRQLEDTARIRPAGTGPEGSHALVIGDPPTDLARLPGARREARRVAALLDSHRYQVDALIYDDGDPPDEKVWLGAAGALHTRPWRVVHIAAHGVMDDDPRRAGVVVGPTIEERLTAVTFHNMGVTPDLVFLNCCHLGRLGAFGTGASETVLAPGLARPTDLAATIAETLMGIGVKAVVVAGWAVDDTAALEFAETFYAHLLQGAPLGEATAQARRAAHDIRPESQTWGAYQVYGSPDFELPAVAAAPEAPRVVSAGDMVRQLQELLVQAGTRSAPAATVRERIATLVEVGSTELAIPRPDGSIGQGTVLDGRVCAALGDALAAVNDLPGAIAAYRAALRAEDSSPDIRTAEQLANACSKQAAVLDRAGERGGAALAREATVLIDRAIDLAGETKERMSIRAGVLKRRAAGTSAPKTRATLAARAQAAYARCATLEKDPVDHLYPANNEIQLGALLAADDATRAAFHPRALALLDQARSCTATDYWDLAAIADSLLTCLLVGAEPDGDPVGVDDVADEYLRAFAVRSQERERRSAVDHLVDLTALAAPASAQHTDLETLVQRLEVALPG